MSQTPEAQADPPHEQGVTLDELTAAYAQSMGIQADSSPAEPESQHPLGDTATDRSADAVDHEAAPETHDTTTADGEPADDDDPCPLSPQTIFEAMLFVGNRESEPLTAGRAAELMRGVSPGDIPALVDDLNRRYASSGCPYRIVSRGAGFIISLEESFHPIRNKFYGRVREARLSQAALDVLAIVAYRQPVLAEDVNRLRGIPSGHLLAQLVRRQLLRIVRPPGKRRPLSYHTTDRFLDLFGLETLDDLPQSEELESR